ncbi:MAG: right-handed parallel beta-helix repeat-containing protein [Magnetococcales bacterium]|nr:right-handed parallel beta-helix repeat-containing protein [Magnetococcales bacterium]
MNSTVGRWLIATLFLLSGCVGSDSIRTPEIWGESEKPSVRKTGNDSSSTPNTLAVLPFTDRTGLLAKKTETVRRAIFNHAARLHGRARPLEVIDSRLGSGESEEESPVLQRPESLAKVVDADGLLYGEIIRYERYGSDGTSLIASPVEEMQETASSPEEHDALQAPPTPSNTDEANRFEGAFEHSQDGTIVLAVRLRLLNHTGREVWQREHAFTLDLKHHLQTHSNTEAERLEKRILTSWAAKGDHLGLVLAARSLAPGAVEGFPKAQKVTGYVAPKVSHLVHDAFDRIVTEGNTFSVILEGEPRRKASLALAGRPPLPLSETSPGTYKGSWTVSAGERVPKTPLTAILDDGIGNRTRWIALAGDFEVDADKPGPVMESSATVQEEGIQLQWRVPHDGSDVAFYRIEIGSDGKEGFTELTEAGRPSYLDTGDTADALSKVYRIQAVDHARNAGPWVVVVPDVKTQESVVNVQPAPQLLTGRLEGHYRMTASGSPYLVDDDVTIPAGSHLIVEAGTRIEMTPRGMITVEGRLTMDGKPNRRIMVTGRSGTPFVTFATLASEEDILIRHVMIRGGDIPLIITHGSPQILKSRVRDSRYNALDIRGDATPLFKECEIRGSSSGGVLIADQAEPVFERTRFIANYPFHIQSASEKKIDVRNNIWNPLASSATILGDVVFKK